MQVTLTWDLLIIIFFAIVMTYSLIIGRNESIKIITATYIATIVTHGVGGYIEQLSQQSHIILRTLGIAIDSTTILAIKLLVFIVTIVLIAVQGGIDVDYEDSGATDTGIAAVLGFATAALLLINLFTVLGQLPLLDPRMTTIPPLLTVAKQSLLAATMISYQHFWFTLPALILIATSFIGRK
ncbi:hypothetical protein COU77_00810 [Candidatus Peregrinibacteria bacterium CG10_big_fil_rev_8_21_14_0_10_49_16]|nr:MAG: hypothetical protein COW95_03070 [Candidatus Peregrinibacteria bacterium CG22_combo_CG10-13_8_21_14_all_49_11]PIR52365.1 MAG: hypothetical protein COU77_00810 [Candidatus Peregrinibacteria bacterium CG10_big_fil_rev_8_21_14_0_10_49_16]